MEDINMRFVEMASPHSWLRVADNLHGQALRLYSHHGQSISRFTDFRKNVENSWDDTNRSVFLLGGFALENAIKSFLVYENPNWISNGKLSRHLLSHSLLRLQNQSMLIPFKNRLLGVLREFERGLDSWARYPCSLSINSLTDEGVLEANLWSEYLRVMRSYGNRLKQLLSCEWHGPHGYYGRWKFNGDFLQSDVS